MHGIYLFESSQLSSSLNECKQLCANYSIYQEIRNHESFGEFYNSVLENFTLNCTVVLKYKGSKHQGLGI
ncbi:hypothetical protein T02_10765 [Trichinella nativa]|uniref:Uncharacterized protein n=1 Tax=Trichinella nativa TaxID=6335 RepID=A0A0V1LUH0_9BILA|nr:hypothetical protein T06_14438 [Trichinella sp. T6]KRZ63165.1 hypothetical protein T02_10765 [Trichinella nativa]